MKKGYKKTVALGLRSILMLSMTVFLLMVFLTVSYAQEGYPKEPKINYYDGNKHMIGGMPYWVEKAGEGKWSVHYGDKKVLWEPKPWQQADYKAQGPAYYNKWMQGDWIYPYELTLEERYKLAQSEPNKSWLRDVELRSYAYCKDWKGTFGIRLVDAKGGERKRMVLEWGRNYKQHQDRVPAEWKNHYYYKFFIVFIEPEDTKGLGQTAIVKSSQEHPDDVYLYLPSQRKVRRLSVGSKKDSFAGTCDKNEDVFNYHTLHPVKFVRSDVLECPPKDVFGYGDSKAEADPTDLHMDGIGGPCWVGEMTPAWPKWWFAKREVWFDYRTYAIQFEKAYDEKGRLIRTKNFNQRVAIPDQFPMYTLWATWDGHDLMNNVRSNYYGAGKGGVDCFYNTDFSETIFSQETLLKELSSLGGY